MNEYYHVDNYQNHIRIKENAPEILNKELAKLEYTKRSRTRTLLEFSDGLQVEKRKPIIGISGGVSDSYQHAEEEYELTRKILQVILEYELPVFILTKSDLVLRDLDLLKEINEKAFCNVCFSIAFDDEDIKKIFEPKSPSIDERFFALKKLRRSGIHGGVIAMPIIPYVGDSVESLKNIAKLSKDSNAEFVVFAGMTLKPGRQKEHFFKCVKNNFPGKYEEIKRIYSNNNKYGYPKESELPLDVMKFGPYVCDETGVRWLSIRHSCPGEYTNNTLVLQRMLEILFIYSMILRKQRRIWKSYHDLVIQLEKGLPDIRILIESGTLGFPVNEVLWNEVKQIIETGTCDAYDRLINEVPNIGKMMWEKID
jgi:DNA repair photolyase